MNTPQHGRLWLVPTPLDHGETDTSTPLSHSLPEATLAAAARLDCWIVENARSARAFLNRLAQTHPLPAALQQIQITELPRSVHKKGDHQGEFDARPLLAPALQGRDIGLASEAGMPAVADPGSSVVRAAHDLGLEVRPLVGPSSLLLAVAAGGLNGQQFAFAGYLPQEAADRQRRLAELEALAARSGQSQLFIETPYRNPALWQALLKGLKPATRLAVASGLGLDRQRTAAATVAQWRQRPAPVDADTPAVFILGR